MAIGVRGAILPDETSIDTFVRPSSGENLIKILPKQTFAAVFVAQMKFVLLVLPTVVGLEVQTDHTTAGTLL